MVKKATPNPFDELRTHDLYRELEAIPAAAAAVVAEDHNYDNVSAYRALSSTEGDKEFILSCWVFNDGTRSAFKEETVSLAKPEPIVIETDDSLEPK